MLTMPHWPVPNWLPIIALGLERVQKLLDALGNPERSLPPTIHVAGTNGKGSTVAYLRAIMEASGRTVHCYTSPHLVNFNERIVLQGHEIDNTLLHSLLEECRLACAKHKIEVTFFEGTTAAALLAFSRIPADILIMETGMGGRLDATNVLQAPLATVITPISYDHMEFLGESLGKIAIEKAGIMRHNVPCVSSLQVDDVELVLEQAAASLNAPLIAYSYDWGVHPRGQGFEFVSNSHNFIVPELGLKGPHQFINAGTAIATALLALPQLKLSEAVVCAGLAKASWPGRLQKLTAGYLAELLPHGVELWLDGAHNPAGAQALAAWLELEPKMPTGLILGMTKKRNVQAFLAPLHTHISHIAGVLVTAEPSSYPASYIANEADKIVPATECVDLKQAVAFLAQNMAHPARIIIAGSLYLVGDALVVNNGYNAVK